VFIDILLTTEQTCPGRQSKNALPDLYITKTAPAVNLQSFVFLSGPMFMAPADAGKSPDYGF
jgi:hypothetical protein